jgi:hypothetical protein
MYLMYVDESGDSGLVNSPTRYFALSGLVVHESRWRDLVTAMVTFRQTIRTAHGLPIRTEIHASHYIRRPPIPGMQRHVRLAILRNLLDEIALQPYVSITNVIVDKVGKPAGYDVFEMAWKVLFQRFHNTMHYGNFPGGHRADLGLIFTDDTNGGKLTRLLRKMAVYNPIPNQRQYGPGYRQLPALKIIEDPHGKKSHDSHFIQAADVCAYFLAQRYAPNAYIRRQGARHYFNRLRAVLNLRAAAGHALGIVEL